MADLIERADGERAREPEEQWRWPRPEFRLVPVLAMFLVALALWIFYSYSQTISIPFGIFRHPPRGHFSNPMLDAAAGPLVHRWIGNRWWSGAIVAALVILSAAQAAALQALWDHRPPFSN